MADELQERIEVIGEQLRAKINSKFQVSALLAGFAFTILSLQVSLLWGEKVKSLILLIVSIFFMTAAIVLYIFSIIRLDELTMPKRFWDEDKRLNTGPALPGILAGLVDQDLWTLKDRMVFYWKWLTLLAILLMSASLFLMLLPFFEPKEYVFSCDFKWLFFIGILSAVFISYIYATWITKKGSKLGNMIRPID